MTERFCLRCDWAGEADEPACPRCGAPLYLMGRSEPTPARLAVHPVHPEAPAEAPGKRGTPLDAPDGRQDQKAGGHPSAVTIGRGRWRVIPLALVLTAAVAFGLTRGGGPDPAGQDLARGDPEAPGHGAVPSLPTNPSPVPLRQCSGDRPPPELPEPAEVVPAPTADYLFQESLSSSLGTAPDLQEIERGSSVFTVDRRTGTTVLRFAGGRGLALAPTTRVIGRSEYTIEVLFRFDFVVGYRKIIDFKDGSADDGLYLLDGCLTFFPKERNAPTSIGSDSYVQVVLTRDATGRVVAYVNGVRQVSFDDRRGVAEVSGSDTLRFFADDATTTGEYSSGAVSQIRLFDRPLSVNEVAAIACTEVTIADATASCRALQQ